MSRERDTVLGAAIVYVGASLAAGTAAFAGAGLAHTRFFAAATGDGVEELGPVFVESTLVQIGVSALVVAPVLAVLVGLVIGRGVLDPSKAIVIGATMGLCGTLFFGAVVAILGSAGTPVGSLRTQSFLVALAVTAGASTVVGGLGSAVGARTG